MPIEDKHMLDARLMYIDLVKRCVLNIPYVDAELNPILSRMGPSEKLS